MTKQTHSAVFRSLDTKHSGKVTLEEIRSRLAQTGLTVNDPRITEFYSGLEEAARERAISGTAFDGLRGDGSTLFDRAIRGDLVIPEFASFCCDIHAIAESVRPNREGQVASYIPQLARVSPEHFAISICTIDGQRFDYGDSRTAFSLQSSCKPLLYSAALEELGAEQVHRHVGWEPSGQAFNELMLDASGRPHNPMINAGAIMTSSLIRRDLPMADRFDHLHHLIARLGGGRPVGFDNATFHSERETADRNFALAHYMREKGAFPDGTDIFRTLDLYFSACSMQVDSVTLAAIGAGLANGGVCPLSEERVFSEDTVKSVLSMMYSCGMYDYSGEFAFSIGVPAKSGVSGVVLAVIPNVAGIAVWSPPLDVHGNSVRGVAFLRGLVDRFNFHNYDNLVKSAKRDPRRPKGSAELSAVYAAIVAASTDDVGELQRLVAHGHDLGCADYDGRTPLHLAAAEGQERAVRYLLDQGVEIAPRDRWKHTPMDDARRHKRAAVIELLRAAGTGAKAAA